MKEKSTYTNARILLYAFLGGIILSLIPFAIYKITPMSAWTSGAGDSVTWVNFWSNYLGGILGAGITAIVSYSILSRQNADNKKQLLVNREQKHYYEAQTACISLINSLNPNRLNDCLFFLSKGLINEAKHGITTQFDEITNTVTLFNLSIESYSEDDECVEFASEVNSAIGRYLEILNMIDVLIMYSELSKEEVFHMNSIVNSYIKSSQRYEALLAGIHVSDAEIDREKLYEEITNLSFVLLKKYEVEHNQRDVKICVLQAAQDYLKLTKLKIDLIY